MATPFLPVKIINGASMAGNITSAIFNKSYLTNICVKLVWTGTPVGTFNVNVSSDHLEDASGNVVTAGVFNALTLNPAPAASGSASSVEIDLNQVSAPYIQISYTAGSSTGTLNAWVGSQNI